MCIIEECESANVSELEVDEGLDAAALHLDDHVDDGGDKQGTYHNVGLADGTDESVLPTVWQIVAHVAECHEHKDVFVAIEHLEQQFWMEIREDLLEHQPTSGKGGVAEENPSETHEVERQENGRPLAPACRFVVLVVVQDFLTEILV